MHVGDWMVSQSRFSCHGSPSPSSPDLLRETGPRIQVLPWIMRHQPFWKSAVCPQSFLSAGDDTALGSEIKEFFVLHGIHLCCGADGESLGM